MKKSKKIWLATPTADEYESAECYLRLLFDAQKAHRITQRLRAAPTIEYAAKDLLRASQTHLLDKDNPEVQDDLKKIKKGKKLAPVLLVRGDGALGTTLTIADGYHRICACWHWDEKTPIACCLASLPPTGKR